jgi:hypothetical protein
MPEEATVMATCPIHNTPRPPLAGGITITLVGLNQCLSNN